MKKCLYMLGLSVFALAGTAFPAQGATVQTFDNVLDNGVAYLFVEAESFNPDKSDDKGRPTTGFIEVSSTSPIQTPSFLLQETFNGVIEVDIPGGGMDVLPADAVVSGGRAMFDQRGAGYSPANAGTLGYDLQFAIPETYYLYSRYTLYNADTNTNYLNEDSIYAPPAFNKNSTTDWIGFQGVSQNSEEGLGEGPVGDSQRDGWMELPKEINDGGDVDGGDAVLSDFWNGNFHWVYHANVVNSDENDVWVDTPEADQAALRYAVTEADLAAPVSFEFTGREDHVAFDGFLFATSPELLDDFTQEQMDALFLNLSGGGVTGDFDGSGVLDLADVNQLIQAVIAGTNDTAFDLTGEGSVTVADLTSWVKDEKFTYIGDANLDGEFNSSDMVVTFSAGKYESGTEASWDQGDWNADGLFNSSDLVSAFSDGGYELGPRAATNAVPEPSAVTLLALGLVALIRGHRRRR